MQSIVFSRPTILILSGHSGAGKTTIRECIMKEIPETDFSVSVTTRERREDECDGIDYIFVGRDDFQNMIDRNELLEYEKVHGNFYGTPLGPVLQALKKPGLHIFDVDVKGGLSIKKRFPETILVFVQPPDLEVLKKRLSGRRTDDSVAIQRRLERIPEERKLARKYDHIITNDHIERALNEITEIIRNYQH